MSSEYRAGRRRWIERQVSRGIGVWDSEGRGERGSRWGRGVGRDWRMMVREKENKLTRRLIADALKLIGRALMGDPGGAVVGAGDLARVAL